MSNVVPLTVPKVRQRRIEMLRAAAGYLSPQAKPYLMMQECSDLGHPAKYDKPPELKTENQRGCICGGNPYA